MAPSFQWAPRDCGLSHHFNNFNSTASYMASTTWKWGDGERGGCRGRALCQEDKCDLPKTGIINNLRGLLPLKNTTKSAIFCLFIQGFLFLPDKAQHSSPRIPPVRVLRINWLSGFTLPDLQVYLAIRLRGFTLRNISYEMFKMHVEKMFNSATAEC